MDRAHKIAEISGKIFDAIWKYDLVTVAGNHIRVGNIILAFTLFLLGIRYSHKATVVIKYYIRNKINDDKDAANALEKIILYIAFALYVITILEIANVPLSTFAFIGGALAIGIGLGAQTLISNFISSLIIMVERPLKIGDVVEVDGVIGTISSVGARCIILTTFSNVEVLVPNSRIMQNTIVNWTLSDTSVRFQAEVRIPKQHAQEQIPYADIMHSLGKILQKLIFVLPSPKSRIYLSKIEKNSLCFLLSFYSNVEEIQNLEHIRSSLNLALLNGFKDYDFSIEYLKIVELKQINDRNEK